MPIRDYECVKCGYKLEDVFFKNDKELDLPECPKCGGKEWKLIPWSCSMRIVGGTPKFHNKK